MHLPFLLLALAAQPSDTSRGQALFAARCSLCHSSGTDARQGPGLAGVVGRKAASTHFGYSLALRQSGLTWTRAELERFLAAPTSVVPGTLMAIALPDPAERKAIVDYLATLKVEPDAGAVEPTVEAPTDHVDAGSGVRTGTAAFGDWRDDAPGVKRHFTFDALPKPYATRSAGNGPNVVARPEGAKLAAPPGFRVEQIAAHLQSPRLLRVAPNGDVFVAESARGQVRVLRLREGALQPEAESVFARGLDHPFGIAFYPPGPDPKWVYVAETQRVIRFAYRSGDLQARGNPEVLVEPLSETGAGHWTRDVIFSADGARMFISVGSLSNVGEELGGAPGGLAGWTSHTVLGAAWGPELNRADVLVFDPQGKHGRTFATGLRNCVGMAVQPTSHELWCSVNERDGLGDDLVNDYVTSVREHAFYGWPWYYLGAHEDPRLRGQRPDLAAHVTTPDVLVQPHSASLQLTFYTGNQFPPEYRDDAFAAFHGSWNRTHRTGYKIERIRFRDGKPTGEVEDFVTGFVMNESSVWGRPVGVAVANDGSLLFTEDGNDTIWRVRYAP